MSKEYAAEWGRYQRLVEAALAGNAQAKKDKARARQECREMERQAARDGKIFVNGRDVSRQVAREAGVDQIQSKREAQNEYIRKFDGTTPVVISNGRDGDIVRDPETGHIVCDPKSGDPLKGNFSESLQHYHRRRLQGGGK